MMKKRTTGPEPERLKIEGDWEAAMKKGLAKKRPPGGWPKPKRGVEVKREGTGRAKPPETP